MKSLLSTKRDNTVKNPAPGIQDHRKTDSHATWQQSAIVLVLLLIAIGSVYCVLPLGSVIKIGADEDFALSKALLSLKGYRMYIDFWNDQPPLHTFLLKLIFSHVSYSVGAARMLTVTAAMVLLTSFFLLVLKSHGLRTAAVGMVLLAASPGFLELSASAMVEISGLAPVILTLCLLQISPRTAVPWTEIMAGLLFAVALQIKLIGAMYLPLIAFALWLRHRPSARPWRDWLVSGTCFSFSLILGLLGIHFLTGESWTAQLAQSRASHFLGTRSNEYGSPADFPFQWDVILKHWDTVVPAIAGCILLVRKNSFLRWGLPCSWLVLTFLVFTNFKPWWNYYYVHTVLPICWLGAVGITTAWEHVRITRKRAAVVLMGIYTLCAGAWMCGRVYLQAADILAKPRTYASPVLNEIKRYRPFASFLWASEPVYAFYANIPIPPKIATLSLKRFWSGDMSNAELIERMRTLRPDIIVITVDEKVVPFQSVLNTDYRLVYDDSHHRLYVLPAVVQQADPWPGEESIR